MRWIETDAAKPRVLSLKRFLTGSGGQYNKIFPVPAGEVRCMVLFSDEKRVACGCLNGSVTIFNLYESKVEREWQAHDRGVWSIAASQDGNLIVTCDFNGVVEGWNVGTGRCVNTFSGHLAVPQCLAITQDGKRIVCVSVHGSMRMWSIETGEMVSQAVHVGYKVACIWLLKDGERAVIGGVGGELRIWNVRMGAQIGGSFQGHTDEVTNVAMTPDERCVVNGSREGTVRLWDVESRSQIWSATIGEWVTKVSVSNDGSQIAAGDTSGIIRVLDVRFGDQVCDPFKVHSRQVSGLSFLGNKDSVISGSWDGTIRVSDIARAPVEESVFTHEGTVTRVSFTPDSRFVVSASVDCTLRVWDALSGQAVGDPLIGHAGPVRDLAVIPDGRFALSASDDCIVGVWDLRSRNLHQKLRGHTSWVTNVAVTPKSDFAVTSAEDSTMRVWDLAKMDGSHAVFGEHKASVLKILLSDHEDVTRVISVDLRDNIYVWKMDTQEILKKVVVQDAWKMPQKIVFRAIGEPIADNDADFSILPGQFGIDHGEGPDAHTLATLETMITSCDVSPDKKTICVGLRNGQVAFLKVHV